MKIVRIATMVLFLLSVLVWGIGKYHASKQDRVPPVIVSDSDEIHVSTGADDAALKKGLTATDDVDGDLTDSIIIANISQFSEKGVCTIEYMVFDQNNNMGFYKRTVCFDDYESPKLYLTAPLMYVQNKEIILSDRFSVVDQLEGDISDKLRFSSSGISQYETGVYELNVEARNSYGDLVKETLLLNVIPYANNIGSITLSEYLIYVPVGASLSPEDYLETVTDRDGNPIDIGSVLITKEVDTAKAGTGQVRYEVKDKNGNIAAMTFLAVIVTEQV